MTPPCCGQEPCKSCCYCLLVVWFYCWFVIFDKDPAKV